jgi:hypothetical protein
MGTTTRLSNGWFGAMLVVWLVAVLIPAGRVGIPGAEPERRPDTSSPCTTQALSLRV